MFSHILRRQLPLVQIAMKQFNWGESPSVLTSDHRNCTLLTSRGRHLYFQNDVRSARSGPKSSSRLHDVHLVNYGRIESKLAFALERACYDWQAAPTTRNGNAHNAHAHHLVKWSRKLSNWGQLFQLMTCVELEDKYNIHRTCLLVFRYRLIPSTDPIQVCFHLYTVAVAKKTMIVVVQDDKN